MTVELYGYDGERHVPFYMNYAVTVLNRIQASSCQPGIEIFLSLNQLQKMLSPIYHRKSINMHSTKYLLSVSVL